MFITVKRHEREKQELVHSNRLIDGMLKYSDQGAFLLDGNDKVLPQVSKSLGEMFRRQDFSNLTFEKLLAPIVSAKTLTGVRSHIAELLAEPPEGAPATPPQPLKDIEVRLTQPDGSSQTAHYWFDFDRMDGMSEGKVWLVRVTDITLQVQTLRELEELRSQTQTQGEILRGVLKMGGARFGKFLQKADASMKTINLVLKKSAREKDAFRSKLEETLEEVDRMRREAAAFKLTALESSARAFEDALHDLRSRSELSGSDFLPLAVKLDQLFGQFTLIKSLALSAVPEESEGSSQNLRTTDKGTRIMEAPQFTAPMAAAADATSAQGTASPPRAAPVGVPTHPPLATSATHRTAAPTGSLDHTLQSLTDHAAHEQGKQVVLECHGLHAVPPRYQAAIKNVAIQLIRNAVMHGIETPAEREAVGKSSHGSLRLEFNVLHDGFELSFEDDGRGLDPDQVRATAIARGVLTGEAAARMRDREAIKLIFKSRYTTLATSDTDLTHGSGMPLVRRYIHEAGGKIALASLAGHETRFRITLPPVPEAASGGSGLELAGEAERVA